MRPLQKALLLSQLQSPEGCEEITILTADGETTNVLRAHANAAGIPLKRIEGLPPGYYEVDDSGASLAGVQLQKSARQAQESGGFGDALLAMYQRSARKSQVW